jgi:hypothetical protein
MRDIALNIAVSPAPLVVALDDGEDDASGLSFR